VEKVNVARPSFLLALWLSFAGVVAASAQDRAFQHVVVIVQENRTPDNLFQGLCLTRLACSTTPFAGQYNIQTSKWRDKTQPSGTIEPLTVPLANAYDLGHSHVSFLEQCDMNPITAVTTAAKTCAMDGAALAASLCTGTCLSQPAFRYVENSDGILNPYLELVRQYGWANYMFQTNQGPSFPAHQFIFGGTSAPSASDDAEAIFADSNIDSLKDIAGCIAVAKSIVALVSTVKLTDAFVYPCFEHATLPDVLPASVTWKYYATGAGNIWTAPNAIRHICQPSEPAGGECTGPEWKKNVELVSADVLKDISNCALANLSWVTPTGQNSDHAQVNTGGGPSWVASIVNAIGESKCKNADGTSYWDSTAILITWDDWGGWYDHEPPTILPGAQGDYQYGFRVPLIAVSAYTSAGMIDNTRYDFGSILRFVEHNFGVSEGILNFADERSDSSLIDFFDTRLLPRPFVPVLATKDADYFLNDTTPPSDPDDD
jgi:phospholipase C